MGITRAYCHTCGQHTKAITSFPHIAHAFLTLVSCGFWALGWAIAYKLDLGSKRNCDTCGNKV
jgi:hypothetical protein